MNSFKWAAMNKVGIIPVLGGLVAGGVLVVLLIIGRPETPSPKQDPEKEIPKKENGSDAHESELKKENQVLRKRVRELQEEVEALKSMVSDPPGKK